MSNAPTRYELWKKAGEPGEVFSLWNRERICEWAIAHGFVADPTTSRGVVVRTQSEANRAAFATLGHAHYDAWLAAHIEQHLAKERT